MAGPLDLRADGLCVSIGTKRIVSDIGFSVAAGQWFGLLGANGSGKTTLLRAMNGRLSIEKGSLKLGGREMARDTRARAWRFGFAAAPDTLPGELTCKELIELVSQARAAPAREPAALYEALGIADLEKVAIWRMSAGMRQRVALFTAFIGEPDAMLLDEPFNWLDPVAAHDLKKALAAWVKAGRILITALHDIAAFATRCDAGLLIHEGRVIRAFGEAAMSTGRGDVMGFEDAVYETFKAAEAKGALSPAPSVDI